MLATQVLPEDISDSVVEDENVSDIVGFLIIENKKYEVKRGETKIGRDTSLCSIIVNNCTISKVHAAIESEGVDDTFIYDVGSTNQTKLGKKVLKPYCRYKLDHDCKLTFGNICAKFLLPSDSIKTNLENLNSLDEMRDIFDVDTQVSIPHPSALSKITVFEKAQEKISSLKIPNPLTRKIKKSSQIDVIQCKMDSSETKSRPEFHLAESSSIFSVNTQCQIYEPSACEAVDENLLNDGEDDVLCSFMSLHSPKAQNELLKEVKIKSEAENSSQLLCTPGAQEKENESKQLKEFFKNSCKLNITSTPLSTKIRQAQSNIVSEDDRCTQSLKEDDLIKLQKFNFDLVKRNEASLQNTEIQPYLADTFDDFPIREQINEDLILTQAFEAVETIEENHQTTTSSVIPETQDFNMSGEDFKETQLYDAEKEAEKAIFKEAKAQSDKNSESHIDETLDFTQKNNEDDLIATQIFEKEPVRKNSEILNASDDEDFIATQPVEINKIQSKEKSLKNFSRESSPDLLCSGGARRNSEDCISTQTFECKDHTFDKIDSGFFSHVNKKNECNFEQTVVIESSGDETESDLEIIQEKNETNKNELVEKFFKSETQSENNTHSKNSMSEEDNFSYVFEPKPELEDHSKPGQKSTDQKRLSDLSDSDATDCEEIYVTSPKILIKQENLEKIEFDETQVLTLTPPDNFVEKTSDSKDDWMFRKESPRFEMENEPWSPLSLEMPNTQDIESSLKKILHEKKDFQTPAKIQKIEVGTQIPNEAILTVSPGKRQTDSPLKRTLDTNITEVVPIKKSKTESLLPNTEKQFSKLVQTHDIAQIQPNRTRNSLRLLSTEKNPKKDMCLKNNITNETPTSRRKSNLKRGRPKKVNGDMTSYVISKKRSKKETSFKEKKADLKSVLVCPRVLRSSLKNSVSPVLTQTSFRNTSRQNTRRSSRTGGEYYSNRRINVVFTGFDCERLEKIIADLGGEKSSDLSRGEVVVADKVRRTVKFLCSIGLGLPIASPEWLLSSNKKKMFLDPWNFILKDEESEEKWNFDLRTSLKRSKNTKLLQGYNVFATESTKPPVKDLLAIVQCCGGTPIFNPPDVWPKKTIIVSCLEDKKLWPLAKLRNVRVVHSEFILSGVLRQKIDFKAYELR